MKETKEELSGKTSLCSWIDRLNIKIGFPGGSDGKETACNVGDPSSIPGSGRSDSLEKKTATHSSILAYRIPCTEVPGQLQSMGHKESDMTDRLTHTHPTAKFHYRFSGVPIRIPT